MAIYEIEYEDPNGQAFTVEIEGDREPSQAEAMAAIEQYNAQGQGQADPMAAFPAAPEGEMKWEQGRNKIYDVIQSMIQKYVQPSLEAGGAVVGGLMAPQAPTVGGAIGMEAGQQAGDILAQQFEKVGMPSKGEVTAEGIAEEAVSGTVDSALDIAKNMILMKGTEKVGGKLFDAEQKVFTKIKDGFAKGIRPTAKKTVKQNEAYMNHAKKSVLHIAREFKNDLPKSLNDFSNKIVEAKGRLVDRWQFLLKQGGKRGNLFDTKPVIDEMKAIARNEDLLLANPAEVRRLQNLIGVWEKAGRYRSLQSAENLLAEYNAMSKSWFQNMNPNEVKAAATAGRIAKTIRENIIKTLEKAGPEYAEMRRLYGSLSEIEKDVSRRAIARGREDVSGFFDVINAQGTGSFVYGLVKMDPAAIAAGAAIKGVGKIKGRITDPDRIVRNMFKDVDKQLSKKTVQDALEDMLK